MKNYSIMEQPKSNGKGREIGKLVISDIESRIQKGIETYGEPLMANNGRDSLIDAYQEALDLAIYLRQVIEENEVCEFKHGETVEILPMTTEKNKEWVKRKYVAYAKKEGQFPHIVKDEYRKVDAVEWSDIRKCEDDND